MENKFNYSEEEVVFTGNVSCYEYVEGSNKKHEKRYVDAIVVKKGNNYFIVIDGDLEFITNEYKKDS